MNHKWQSWTIPGHFHSLSHCMNHGDFAVVFFEPQANVGEILFFLPVCSQIKKGAVGTLMNLEFKTRPPFFKQTKPHKETWLYRHGGRPQGALRPPVFFGMSLNQKWPKKFQKVSFKPVKETQSLKITWWRGWCDGVLMLRRAPLNSHDFNFQYLLFSLSSFQ